jgi:transposase-like protein
MVNKKVKVRFCPKCKSFNVGYTFGLSSWIGLSPRMRCRDCKFEMPSFPILTVSKKKLESRRLKN